MTDFEFAEVDMREFDRWTGVPHGGEQVKYPMSIQDFRRWATHTDNYNPLYFDEDWVSESRFGAIVAPRSFTGLRVVGETVYRISEQELIPFHVADEYFFEDRVIQEGDCLSIDRTIASARAAKTRLGPSAFVDVDIAFRTQRGLVLTKRATSMLTPAANTRMQGASTAARATALHDWTPAELADIMRQKADYVGSWRTHEKLLFGSIAVGDALPRSVLGPHTGATFLYAEACGTDDVWGMVHTPADQPTLLPVKPTAGTDPIAAAIDERLDILPMSRGQMMMYEPVMRGHIYDNIAVERGMPRAFGVGSISSIWGVDYFANWAREWGSLRRLLIRFGLPVLSGDITLIDAVVTGLTPEGRPGHGMVHVSYTFKNQDGVTSCSGEADVELPFA